jgi:hypothetical protein
MRERAMACAIVLAGVLSTVAFGGAPAEIRHLPDRLDIFDWPGERPPAVLSPDRTGEPRPVEVLRHEGTQFLVVPRSRSIYGDVIRVKATANRTVIRLNGRAAVTLDASEDWVFTPGWVKLRIESTQPVVMSFLVAPAP